MKKEYALIIQFQDGTVRQPNLWTKQLATAEKWRKRYLINELVKEVQIMVREQAENNN